MAPKKSKRSASEDDSTSDSGPDDRNPPPKKTKTSDKGSSKKDSEKEEHSWMLDKTRFIKVRDFRGKILVDIREFYEKNGELLPGKKGISLSISQWNKLKEVIDDVQESIEQLG